MLCMVSKCPCAGKALQSHGDGQAMHPFGQAPQLEAALEAALLPRDAVDDREVVLEVRAPSAHLVACAHRSIQTSKSMQFSKSTWGCRCIRARGHVTEHDSVPKGFFSGLNK